jgi:hypothetical protein
MTNGAGVCGINEPLLRSNTMIKLFGIFLPLVFVVQARASDITLLQDGIHCSASINGSEYYPLDKNKTYSTISRPVYTTTVGYVFNVIVAIEDGPDQKTKVFTVQFQHDKGGGSFESLGVASRVYTAADLPTNKNFLNLNFSHITLDCTR